MGRQIKAIYKKAEVSFNNPEHKKKWQGGIGIVVMVVFVLSSVLFNETVQAVNRVAGSYGYYSGSYGYNSTTSSDYAPSAPSISIERQVGRLVVTVTAPSTTVGGTSAEGTGTLYLHNNSGCTGTAVSSGSVAAGAALTAYNDTTATDANTTYSYCAQYTDNNNNNSAYATTSSAGGLASGGGSFSSGPAPQQPSVNSKLETPKTETATVPGTGPVEPLVATAVAKDANALVSHLKTTLGIKVARDTKAEAANTSKLSKSEKEFGVTLNAEVKPVISNFVTYGVSKSTVKLGSGERLAVVRDGMDTMGAGIMNNTDKFLRNMEDISSGKKPTYRNLTKEQQQVSVALGLFKKTIIRENRAPNFKNAQEDMAWNMQLYRIRPSQRDLKNEGSAAAQFTQLVFRPAKSPLEWATVKAMAYAGVKASAR